MSDREVVLNENIHCLQVRLVAEGGEQLGVVATRDALARARSVNLDLVLVADSGKGPPVCKILDAGRWLYERQKQEKATARKQREFTVETKEIRLRPVTSANDLDIKMRKARAFLSEGDRVKLVVRFKGREQSHKDQGRAILARFLTGLGDHKIERPITDIGRDMSMLVAPLKTKVEIARST